MSSILFAVFALLLFPPPSPASAAGPFLQVNNGSATGLSFGGQDVFLSGANLAWIDYGNDFGNNQGPGKACALRQVLVNVSQAGGNSLRIWLFTEGQSIPQFDSNGMVNATDAAGSMVSELRAFLADAAHFNVFVTLCLWNGALMRNANVKNLLTDDVKLQSFFDKALTPLVTALRDEPALAAWEIMNEPEGSVDPTTVDPNPCFDTQKLANTGAGWAGHNAKMRDLLHFFNRHAAVIHAADAKALVTVGSWSQVASTDAPVGGAGHVFFNYYKDQCLIAAGGQPAGTLDFYQVHTYAQDSQFETGSPFADNIRTVSDYQLDKPMVIGEFSAGGTHGQRSIQSLYSAALLKRFAGAWDWCFEGDSSNDNATVAMQGMGSISSSPLTRVTIGGGGSGATCSCSDIPPDHQYTCAQQASWGKCNESWMQGFCCLTCHGCRGCS